MAHAPGVTVVMDGADALETSARALSFWLNPVNTPWAPRTRGPLRHTAALRTESRFSLPGIQHGNSYWLRILTV